MGSNGAEALASLSWLPTSVASRRAEQCTVVFLLMCILSKSYTNKVKYVLNITVVMIAIVTFGVVSGAHINPSVSIAAYIYGDLSLVMLLLYFVAQFTGALCGYGLLMGVAPQAYFDEALVNGHGSCVTAPHASLTAGSALAIEFIVTGILVWTCCGIWDPRNAPHHDSVPIKFGLLVATIAVAAGPATGGSMNPARTLAPCVWNNSYHEIWIYFVGPSLAAVIMPIVYKFVFRKEA